MSVAISIDAPPSCRGLALPLRALIRAALASQDRRPGAIAIVLTGDAELRTLNRDWRGIDRATDVLSFSYDEAAPGTHAAAARTIAAHLDRAVAPSPRRAPLSVNGDLVISLDRVREQARRFRVTEGEELARLVIHGALHLAGLDHQRPAERTHMRVIEERVLVRAKTVARALAHGLAPATSASPAGRRAARTRARS